MFMLFVQVENPFLTEIKSVRHNLMKIIGLKNNIQIVRGTLYPSPLFIMWWRTQWCANGYFLWRSQQEDRMIGGVEMLCRAVLFYSDGGIIASTNPKWMQREFDSLSGFLDRKGFQTNVRKTFGILYRPCHAVRTQQEEYYKFWMKHASLTYLERRRLWFQ